MKTPNPELGEKLAHLLSDVVSLGFLAQGYHWNVKGMNFSQFHKFFAKIYEDIDSAIDPLAENIRKLGFDAPYLLEDFQGMTCIRQERLGGDPLAMLSSLAETNSIVSNCYVGAFTLAESCNEQGIADFLAGRIDMHAKWQWQLEASLGLR
jgi:starvation-inducible DNA-binding protein